MRRWPLRLAIAIVAILVVAWAVFRTPDVPVADLRAKYGSPASQYVEITPGQIIHLRDEGPRDGFPVLLLHGSNASVHTWEPWVAALKGRYRVISFDFPGHGLSSPAPSGQYGREAFTTVVELIAAREKLTRFAIGGNSMGGGIAWTYAHRHPEQIAALILVDAGGQPDPGQRKLPIGFRIALMPGVRTIATSITPRSMIADSLHQTVAVQSVVTPTMIDRYWELLRYPGNRQATMARFAGYPHEARAPDTALPVPAAIVWGREDKLIPVASAAWFKARLPNASVTILEGVGHIPMEEAPAASLAPVQALLDRVSAGSE